MAHKVEDIYHLAIYIRRCLKESLASDWKWLLPFPLTASPSGWSQGSPFQLTHCPRDTPLVIGSPLKALFPGPNPIPHPWLTHSYPPTLQLTFTAPPQASMSPPLPLPAGSPAQPVTISSCSDGAGRTGTYILIDMVLNRMAKGEAPPCHGPSPARLEYLQPLGHRSSWRAGRHTPRLYPGL